MNKNQIFSLDDEFNYLEMKLEFIFSVLVAVYYFII